MCTKPENHQPEFGDVYQTPRGHECVVVLAIDSFVWHVESLPLIADGVVVSGPVHIDQFVKTHTLIRPIAPPEIQEPHDENDELPATREVIRVHDVRDGATGALMTMKWVPGIKAGDIVTINRVNKSIPIMQLVSIITGEPLRLAPSRRDYFIGCALSGLVAHTGWNGNGSAMFPPEGIKDAIKRLADIASEL